MTNHAKGCRRDKEIIQTLLEWRALDTYLYAAKDVFLIIAYDPEAIAQVIYSEKNPAKS